MDAIGLQNLKNRYDIIGNDRGLNEALESAIAIAPYDLGALIVGESGVGKEVIPQIIHQNSHRRTGKYFAINCGAIPEGTIDSELFGHEKGAFTGATEMRKGYFEEANGGTLFLDEIGELPMSSQAKLLRVLQSGEFIRVGSSKVLKTDVRVIAATNVDLKYAVQQGKFRSDLYYRLGILIHMPSLRERPDDIPLLFRKFTSDFSERYQVCKINLSHDAVALLKSYRWPGNIRQLKNVVDEVSMRESYPIAPGRERVELTAAMLDKYIPKDDVSKTLPSVAVTGDTINNSEKEAIVRSLLQIRQEVDYLKETIASLRSENHAAGQVPNLTPVLTSAPQPVEEAEWQDTETAVRDVQQDQNLSIQSLSTDLIKKALERNNGNRKAAAADLGISERTLYRRLKETK